MATRNFRGRESFADLKIAYAHQLARFACAFRPNIAVDVLGHSHHHSKWLVIGFRDAAELAILEQI